MPDLREHAPSSAILSSLFVQAIREGQSLWFRVASSSMFPLFQVDDTVFIVPSSAHEIQPGEIAAFETGQGLVIHRIIHREQTGQTIRLLQMSDVDLFASFVREEAVVGRVTKVRKGEKDIDLDRPIAKWYGRIVASARYRLYLSHDHRLIRLLWRACSRLSLRLGYWSVRRCCTIPAASAGS